MMKTTSVKKMRLKVPVNSYNSAVSQIAAGADEIYMGLEDTHFNRMSYSARAQVTSHGVRANFTDSEFVRTVEYAHEHDVQVCFTANCQHVSNSDSDFYRKGFLDYVQRGVDLGADTVIVGDIGTLITIREHGFQIPLVAGSYLGAFNSDTVALLKYLGVIRVCLPDQLLFDELKSIKAQTDIEIEIFIGYGCSNLSGSCNFCHNNGERERVGVTCRANFKTEHYGTGNVLDVCTDCAICSIPKLYDLGIDSLKLIGRESDCIESASITKMYRTAIDGYTATRTLDRTKILACIPWWEEAMCPDRCKYENSKLLQGYL